MLTPLQAACLTSIIDHLAAGRQPSVRGLARSLGASSHGRILPLLRALQERGYIRCEGRGHERQIAVLRRPTVSVYRWDEADKKLIPMKTTTARSSKERAVGGVSEF